MVSRLSSVWTAVRSWFSGRVVLAGKLSDLAAVSRRLKKELAEKSRENEQITLDYRSERSELLADLERTQNELEVSKTQNELLKIEVEGLTKIVANHLARYESESAIYAARKAAAVRHQIGEDEEPLR